MASGPQTRSRPIVWVLRLVALVAFMDLFMGFPIISTYARSVGAAEAMRGFIIGIYSASNLVGNVGAGFLLDKISRKWLIVAGLLITAALLFAYGLVDSPGRLLTLRILHGLAAGILAPGAFAMIADYTDDDQHTRSMGLSGVLIAAAAVVGPLLSVGVRDAADSFTAVFAVSGVFMLVSAVAFIAFIPNSPPARSNAAPRGETLRLSKRSLIFRVYLGVLAMAFAFGCLINLLPVSLEDAGAAPRIAGIAIATLSLAGMVIMASPMQRSAGESSRARAIALGLVLLVVSNIVLGLFGDFLLMLAVFPSMLIFGIGFGMLFPSLNASVAARTADGNRGAAFGIFYAVYSLGASLGAYLPGIAPAVGLDGVARFYMPALILIVALLVSTRLRDLRG